MRSPGKDGINLPEHGRVGFLEGGYVGIDFSVVAGLDVLQGAVLVKDLDLEVLGDSKLVHLAEDVQL